MDWHGPPRFQNGPPEKEVAPFQFKTEKQALQYVLGRGRTHEQAVALVAAAQMGLAISQVMGSLKRNLWVVKKRGPVTRPSVPELSEDCTFVRAPPKEFPAELNSAVAFADLAIEVVDATRHLISLAKRLRAWLDQNPAVTKSLKHWTSDLQMATAFTLHAAQTLKLSPTLGHREMEAVALLVGYRDGKNEFTMVTKRQQDNWRKHFEKVKTKLLPALLSLTPPLASSPAEPREP